MRKLGFALAGALLTVAAGSAAAQEIRIGLQEDPDVLDPARARTYVGRIVFTSLCDKLVDIDPKLRIVPQLATSWSWNADNTVLTMKLRDDVVFHDGTKFDAAAAKANLDRSRTLQDSFRKGELASISKVDAPDANTLVLTLKQPDATLLSQLTDRAGMMLSPAIFNDKDANAVGRNPVCSGPYKFVERVQNDRIVLEKFDKYYDAKSYNFTKVTFLPIPDTTVRLQNLRSGGLDILERLNPSDAPDVKKDDRLHFSSVAGLGFQEIVFNQNNGERAKNNPFRDERVRQALSLSIDRDAINEVIGGGIYEPANQAFPPASPYHSDKFPVPKRDVAKAKALLKEAGMTQVKAELAYGNNTTTAAIAEMMQAMARESGIELSLRPTDYAALLSQMHAGNFEVALRGWSGRPDPDGNVYPFVTCKGALNDGQYCNAKVDELLNEARKVPDEAKRKVLYEQAEAIIQKEMPDAFLYFQPWPFAMQRKVKGFLPYPDGMIRLKGVSFAQN
ncbi:ABC transporter substrate-binding protein [Bordetella genomosp. 9]|uniref:ABC transporter substrate-binding protein n=1 Tax=Bordetella genomosp. 9 TaxID=1416803 RepID=A0A1W6YZC6_9BORD|nr:ABC transporter substrate-binding protein [Bordetella genomosp. 9]ARP86465.1 ABC transporter substrate-binding protein [Bordetella genomosp. 9]ARP90480.1 ABC transporter substrate-binding protein [Bordetella genomosp. 9]